MKARRSALVRTGETSISGPSPQVQARDDRSDDPQTLAHAGKHLEDEVELLRRVRRRIRRADARLVRGDGRRDHGIGEHAVVVELSPELEREEIVADDDGDDRRLAATRVETERAQ